MSENHNDSARPLPSTVSEFKHQLEAGECFVWEHYNRRLYFEFVETVGPTRTETDGDGEDPHTRSATLSEIRAALRVGGIERVDHAEIPGGESA